MEYSIKEIYEGTNITDSGCQSKIARFNNILADFAIEVYDLYPQKIVERFAPADCKAQVTTTYPIAKVWGFWGKGCNVKCSERPEDCCAGYRKLLMEEMYGVNLDANTYSWEYPNKVNVVLPEGLTDAFVVYSRGFPKVENLNDKIELDPYLLSLLRLYMKAEYAMESNNDINMSANYRSLFQSKLKKMKEMYDNNIKYVFPGGLSIANK